MGKNDRRMLREPATVLTYMPFFWRNDRGFGLIYYLEVTNTQWVKMFRFSFRCLSEGMLRPWGYLIIEISFAFSSLLTVARRLSRSAFQHFFPSPFSLEGTMKAWVDIIDQDIVGNICWTSVECGDAQVLIAGVYTKTRLVPLRILDSCQPLDRILQKKKKNGVCILFCASHIPLSQIFLFSACLFPTVLALCSSEIWASAADSWFVRVPDLRRQRAVHGHEREKLTSKRSCCFCFANSSKSHNYRLITRYPSKEKITALTLENFLRLTQASRSLKGKPKPRKSKALRLSDVIQYLQEVLCKVIVLPERCEQERDEVDKRQWDRNADKMPWWSWVKEKDVVEMSANKGKGKDK